MDIPTRDEALRHNRKALLLKAALFVGLFLVIMAFTSLGAWVQGKLPKDGLWPAVSAFVDFSSLYIGPLLIVLALIGFTRTRKSENSGGA